VIFFLTIDNVRQCFMYFSCAAPRKPPNHFSRVQHFQILPCRGRLCFKSAAREVYQALELPLEVLRLLIVLKEISRSKPVEEGWTMPNREQAWNLLCEYTLSESLRKHALAVEACLRAYATKQGQDPELWGITGLLHDFDYERWPNAEHHATQEHPYQGSQILRELGYPEEMIHAILGHAHYCNVARVSPLDRTLFACDELSGFLTACALIKPSKSIHEVEAASVKKKLKDKAFARGVNREDVYKGAEELETPLDEHIAFCIAAMRAVAPELGLAGVGATA